jgi:hypothetical protein
MLVHHLLTKSVLLLSAIMVWGFSALMNLPYLIAVQYIEMQNRKTGASYGVFFGFFGFNNCEFLDLH